MKRSRKIGGYAVKEGIMMIVDNGFTHVIKKPDGDLITESGTVPPVKNKFLTLPGIRVIYSLLKTMKIGMWSGYRAALISGRYVKNTYSPSTALFISLYTQVFLYFLIPCIFAEQYAKTGVSKAQYILAESIIKVIFFLVITLLSLLKKDNRRIYMYHGAEHMTIHCYEHDEPLTLKNVKKYSTLHQRCGTTLTFAVILGSLIVFPLIPRYDIYIDLLIRFLLLPVITMFAGELTRLDNKYNLWITKILLAPSLLIQLITTRKPDDEMIEMAIAALNKAAETDSDIKAQK